MSNQITNDHKNGVMIYADAGDGTPKFYYLKGSDLQKFPMKDGTPGWGEGTTLIGRGAVLSLVKTDSTPVGSFSTLVNVAQVRKGQE